MKKNMPLPYQDPHRSPEERTRDLLSRMTVKEKIGQLVKLDGFDSYDRTGETFTLRQRFTDTVDEWCIGSMYGVVRADWWTERNWSNGAPPEKMAELTRLFQSYVLSHSRLGIPLYVAEEAPHGLMAMGATVFPTGLGLGCSWDRELIRRVGLVIGAEAAAAGAHAVYGPVLDVIRDPRWSRAEENFSEDAYLTSIFAREMVTGITANGTVSTLKHFVAHGSSEGGHNTQSAHVGMIELHNCQLRPFAAGIRAGALSLMSAYNDVDGMPATGSRRLLTDILRGELGFQGFVVSDRTAIPSLRWQRHAPDEASAAARALKAGCDADEGCLEFYTKSLLEALERHLITEEDLDRAAGHVLKTKFAIGLFEHPYRAGNAPEVLRCQSHEAVALEAARKAMTLVRNDGCLPFDLAKIRRLAVIGPDADSAPNQLGDYTAPQREGAVTTVLAGLRAAVAGTGTEILYARGCGVRSRSTAGFAEAERLAQEADAVVLVLGGCSTKYGSNMVRSATGESVPEVLSDEASEKESGEGTDRSQLGLSGVQLELFRLLKACGKPVAVVLIQGRPLQITELLHEANAVLLAWYPGQSGGQAVAEVLMGAYNPAGRLAVSIPYSTGQLPVYYNPGKERNAYLDCPGEAELPFGFGLSYTKFSYSKLHLEGRTLSVEVTNAGERDGEEVVQFYLTSHSSEVTRPILELVGFERVMLKAGESRKVATVLTDELLGYYNESLQFVVEHGCFTLSAGGNSKDLLKQDFML